MGVGLCDNTSRTLLHECMSRFLHYDTSHAMHTGNAVAAPGTSSEFDSIRFGVLVASFRGGSSAYLTDSGLRDLDLVILVAGWTCS